MAYSDNNNIPVHSENKDKFRNSSELLPLFFRTETNKKFLGAGLDSLISKGELERINGFVGSRYSRSVKPEDRYLPEPTSNRRRYNLLPSLVIRDEFDDRTEWLATYDDFINQIKYFNGNTDRHDRLNSSEFYAWNPHIDFDKFVNYRQYYWLQNGPSPVTITGYAEGSVSGFTVSNNNSQSWVFTPDGSSNNPVITLYRGATYKFELNAPGHPFYIKNARTTGSSDAYSIGVTNNGTETGVVIFTVSETAPDILYYVCGVHQEMQGIFEIKNAEEELNINIPTEILGKTEYTSANGVKFTNGLVVNFEGNITPSTYKNKNFVVEGVGKEIKLVAFNELDTPEIYSQNFDYEFDIDKFDDTPFDDAENTPDQSEYVTINRSSIDKNPWSRYNRWFHKDVIEKSAEYNNAPLELDENTRAKRPIVEFMPNIQLYNFATQGLGNVDLIDTVTTDVFSDIEGHIGYYVDQVDLEEGMRVIFNADSDITVKGKVYQVTFVTHEGKSRIHLVEQDVPLTNQGVVITDGVDNQGTSWYFDGTVWVKGQQKTSLNQAPLFDLFDNDNISFTDSTKYNVNSFTGNELVSYKIGSGSNDPVLGFPISYQNINNIGDIEFEFDWDDQTFVYSDGTKNITVDTASGSIKVNKDLTTYNFENGWSLVNDQKLKQPIVQLNDTVQETPILQITAIQNPGKHLSAENITVEYSGVILKSTDFTTVTDTNGNALYLRFTNAIPSDVRIITKIFTDQKPTNTGHYEPPKNLTNNSENNDLKTFTLGSVTDHFKTMFENNELLTGKLNASTNARDLKELYKSGRRYIKHRGSLLPAIFGLVDSETNIVKAIRKTALDYNVFKQQFLTTFDTVPIDGTPRDDIDTILYKMSLKARPEDAYYYSDMLGYGRSLVKQDYTVSSVGQQIFGIQNNYNLTTLSNRSVYVYYNGTQLLNGVDYTFDAVDNTVTVNRNTVIGDKVSVYDYSTVGNIIPPTPTKLGLFPKFTPRIYVDNTYATPTKVIQGHDGSKTVAYNDYRDELLLELEKRIYNNIKVAYKRNIFDNNEHIPGGFRSTEYSTDEFNSILQDDFGYWANLYDIEFEANTTTTEAEQFTYNYSSAIDTISNQPLPGHWRAIYKKFYDTDRPHTDPWEMLGYNEKPAWWEDRYGQAPYTSGNNILWNDLEKGFDYGTGKINSIYARANLSNYIPVDEYGDLKTPTKTNLIKNFLITTVTDNWVFGDHGPAETAWRTSSWYPYALQTAMALMKPAEYLTTQFDTAQNIVTASGNTVYKDTGKIIDFTDVKINDVYYDDVRFMGAGYHNIITQFLKIKSVDLKTGYSDRIKATSMNLAYKVGGFVNKERLRVLLESSNPNTADTSIFLPQENYEITFRKSNPIFSAKISGVVVEKVNNGYKVKGYDRYQPTFNIFKPKLTVNDRGENIGGVSANFVLWQQEKFYGIGQIVQYENQYYRTKTDHTSTTTFDNSKFTRIPELPLTGGASVQVPTNFETTVSQVPYNTILPNVQEVYNLLLGYEKYLESIGFVFDNVINDLGELSNWSLSGKEFLYWTTQNFAVGSVITLSPFAEKCKFKFQSGQVDNVLDSFYEYSIYNAGGNIIPSANISTVRDSNIFTIRTKNTSQGIYNIQLNLVQKEHAIVFDDRTIFGDVIYDQEAGYRQERIKLIGFKTTEWNGDLYSPGFIYDEAKISEWTSFKDYNLGDTIKYKNKYYSAKSFLPGVETFNYSDWIYLGNQPNAELLPNLDYKISNFEDFYNLDTETFDLSATKLSQHLVGYQKRTYLDNLIQDNTSQYKFYQGFIKEKGTQNSINSISRLKIDDVQTSVTYDEEWAFKVGSLGSNSTVKEIEFALDEAGNVENPQGYDFVATRQANATDGNIIKLLPSDIAVKPGDYNNSPWPTITLNADTGITSGYINKLPVAGFPRIDDIPTTAFSFNDMIGNSVINILDEGDLIWVAKDRNNDWNIYQLHAIRARVVETDDLKTEFANDQITFNTDIPHGLVKNQIISIKGFQNNIDNVYLVEEVTSKTQFKVSGGSSSTIIDDSTSGTILEFASHRVNNIDEINSVKNITKVPLTSKIYADNDGTGKWAVYEKTKAFEENKWGAPNQSPGQLFGYNIVTGDSGRLIVIAAPNFGDEGQVYILRREFNTGIGTLQVVQGYAISDNASDNIVSDAGKPALGTALALSADSTVLAAGAPKASNFKSVDDSSRIGFRVSEGDFTADPSDLSAEGVVTLHTYDTQDNLFKRNYIIGSPDPQTNSHFGESIAVSNTKLIVGAPGQNNYQGKIYIFDKVLQDDGSTLDWELSEHSELYLENARDGDQFGWSISATSDLQYLAVGAHGTEAVAEDSSTSKGSVYIYRLNNNEYQLIQTIDSTNFTELNDGDKFGWCVKLNPTGETLIVSAPWSDKSENNSGNVYYFTRINDDSTTFEEGVPVYSYVQTIYSPESDVEERFGDNLAVNPAGDSIAVYSKGGRNLTETTFDVFTIREDSTQDDNPVPTTFDGNSLKIIDEDYLTGTVFTYTKLNSTFVFGQKLNSETVDEFDNFGQGLAYSENSIMVGAPNNVVNGAETGGLFVYQKQKTAGWNKLRTQDTPTDPYLIKKAFTYNISTNQVKDFLEVVDPVKGKIPYLAEAELAFKSDVDPAVYTQGSGVTVNPNTAWTEDHVGELWWDLSTVRYVWYEQGDTEYRKSNWGTLFPGSTIDVYEWVETDVLPTEWNELSGTQEGIALGFSGVAKYDDETIVTKRAYDFNRNTFVDTYYYWVKNKVTVPNVDYRNISAIEVATIIADPQAYGIKSIQLLSNNSLSVSNIKTTLDDKNIHLNIQYRNIDTDIPEHNEWQLLSPKQTAKIDNELLVKKLVDSLVGYDSQGNPVPDPALPIQRKYGIQIRPRQTMFDNRLTALETVIKFANDVMKQQRIVDTKNITKLFDKDPVPTRLSGKWDLRVDDETDLEKIGTQDLVQATAQANTNNGRIESITVTNAGYGYINPPEIEIVGNGTGAKLQAVLDSQGRISSINVLKKGRNYSNVTIYIRPFKVLVDVDSSAGNFWSLYEWQASTKIWNRTNTQTYDLTRFWSYKDYIVEGFNTDRIIDYKLTAVYELNTITPETGELVEIQNAGDGNRIILEKVDSNGTFTDDYDLKYKANSTIEFNENIYNYSLLNFGYAGLENFDINLFDAEPIIETRKIIEIIRDDIFVDNLRTRWNELFFIAVRYALSEQNFVDWTFKTSFINVNNNLGNFSRKLNYKLSDPGYIESYIKEVKPYSTVIRNFYNSYSNIETSSTGLTDFDLPSYWDEDDKKFKAIKVTDDLITTQPYANWFDNYKYSVGSVAVTNKGAGYTESPLVVFSGGRESKPTIAQTAGYRNVVTTDYNESRFFVKTTSVPDHGFARNESTGTVKIQNYTFSIPRTPVQAQNPLSPQLDPIGVAVNGVLFKSFDYGLKESRGNQEYTVNSVAKQKLNDVFDGHGEVGTDGLYFYHADPIYLYTKDDTQHSPLLGYAVDGHPIYGPYGYDTTTGTTNPRVMKTSYRLKTAPRADGSTPDGYYIEDYEFVTGLGDLDQHNGRTCITPEYPNGTYAYFVTVDPDNTQTSIFPYIMGPTYYGAPVLPNGNFTLPGTQQVDAKATAYISRGIVREIIVTNNGSGYASAPTITLTGGGGSDAVSQTATAYAILENKKVRINTVNMKFDRIGSSKVIQSETQVDTFTAVQGQIKFKLTYLPTLDKRDINININNETAYIENYDVSIVTATDRTYSKREGYIIFSTPPGQNADVVITYKKSIDLMQATDRIDYYYTPTAGMLGKDPAQLMTGVEYDGVQVQGLEFDISVGWDGLPWFSHGWDTFSGTNTDYAFRADGTTTTFTLPYTPDGGQEINIYFDGVRQDPTNTPTIIGDGSTDSFTLNVAAQDGTLVVFRQKESDGSLVPTDVNNLDSIIGGGNFEYTTATGNRPEDISLDGDGFVTVDTSHAPEEVVPGQAFDSVVMKVYNAPADGSPIIQSNRYWGDSLTRRFSFDQYPGNNDSVYVTVGGIYLEQGSNNNQYQIDWQNKEIVFTDAPEVDELVTIQTLNVGGSNILERRRFENDNSTTAFDLTAKYEDVGSAYVTVNGVSQDHTLSKNSSTGGTTVTLTNPPDSIPADSVVQVVLLSTTEKSFSEIIRETVIDDGSSSAYTLTNIPGNIAPYHAMVIVEIKDGESGEYRRLLPPDTVYYVSNGVTQDYLVSQDPAYPIFTLALGEIEVHLNGIRLVPIRDYNFDTQTNLVSFNQNVLSSGDAIAITILRNHEYELNVSGDSAGDREANLNILLDRSVVKANTEYRVTTFTNHDANLLRKEVFTGKIGGTYKLSRPAIDSNYVWVDVDGRPLVSERDYKILDNNNTIYIDDAVFDQSSLSRITVMSFSEEASYDSIGYQIFNDMLNRTHFKRISEQDSTTLSQKLSITDKEIKLTDASFLQDPSPSQKIPGVIWIDRERIEFYTKSGNTLGQITRGTLGTGSKTEYSIGTLVFDAGPNQTIPYSESINVYGSVITPNLPNGRKEHVLETINISSGADAHDQVEVYLGGRKLQKPTPNANPIKQHNIEIAFDSDEVNSAGTSSDVVQTAEFTIVAVTDSTAKNYYKLVLRDEPQDGLELKVVQKQGKVWYEQGVNTASTGTTLQRNETAQAKFLLERTSGLPVINIRE